MKIKLFKSLGMTFFTFLCVLQADAAPIVSSFRPTQDRGVWKIEGQNLGVKNPAPPMGWADFESGINPTPLGRKTAWDGIENMVWAPGEGKNGTGGVKAADGSGRWTLRSDHNNWSEDRAKTYMSMNVKNNHLITDNSQNWKILRWWASGFRQPDIYAAENNGRVYVENNGGPESGGWGNFRNPSTDWVRKEFILQNSSFNNRDGLLAIIYDNVEKMRTAIMTRCTQAPEYMTMNFVLHYVGANYHLWNPAWSSNNRMWADDIYFDNSWQRVVVGDASTYSQCRQLEMQIPQAWDQNGIFVHARQGSFAGSTQVYLYVFDENGVPNEQGFPFRFSDGPVARPIDPPQPVPIDPPRPIEPPQPPGGGGGGGTPPPLPTPTPTPPPPGPGPELPPAPPPAAPPPSNEPKLTKNSIFYPGKGEKLDVFSGSDSPEGGFEVYDIKRRKVKSSHERYWDGTNDNGEGVVGLHILQTSQGRRKVVVLR